MHIRPSQPMSPIAPPTSPTSPTPPRSPTATAANGVANAPVLVASCEAPPRARRAFPAQSLRGQPRAELHGQQPAPGSRRPIRGPEPPRIEDVLLQGMADDATPAQIATMQTLLQRVRRDANGAIILDALRAYHVHHGKAPRIVLRPAGIPLPARPSLHQPVDTDVWHLDVNALASGPLHGVVHELSAVYNNITGLLQGRNPYGALLASGHPSFEPELERAWQDWIARQPASAVQLNSHGRQIGRPNPRRRVVAILREKLRELRCHGGLSHAGLSSMLKADLAGRRAAVQPMTINLAAQGIDSIPPLPHDVRALVVSHNPIKDWHNLPDDLRALEAAHAGLRHVPDPLPKRLVKLNLHGNAIVGIDKALPEGIVHLDLGDNAFDAMPVLPGSVRRLWIGDNRLGTVGALPAGLRDVDLAGNRISRLPANLPATLEYLDVSSNRLTGLPDSLPVALQQLRASRNQLASLPSLPAGLRVLEVMNNLLVALPDRLPRGLQIVAANFNWLERLPEDLPTRLRDLGLMGNNLTSLPPNINTLTICDIDVTGNPIAARDIPARMPGERGPRISYTPQPWHDGDVALETISQAVGHWLENVAGDQAATAIARWNALGPGLDGSARGAAFRDFLQRLAATVNSKDEAFRKDIREWLAELARPERETLRDMTFDVCFSATESCEDRISWTLNGLRTLRVDDDIRLGLYDGRPHAVVAIARQMYRLDALARIARAHVDRLDGADELGVYLGFAVKLRDKLDLTTVVPDMRFFDADAIGQDDLQQALRNVQDSERNHFHEYLCIDYPPWSTMLGLEYGSQFDEARQKMQRELDRRMEPELEAKIAELGLARSDPAAIEDARRELGARLAREIRISVLGALTQRYLASP